MCLDVDILLYSPGQNLGKRWPNVYKQKNALMLLTSLFSKATPSTSSSSCDDGQKWWDYKKKAEQVYLPNFLYYTRKGGAYHQEGRLL